MQALATASSCHHFLMKKCGVPYTRFYTREISRSFPKPANTDMIIDSEQNATIITFYARSSAVIGLVSDLSDFAFVEGSGRTSINYFPSTKTLPEGIMCDSIRSGNYIQDVNHTSRNTSDLRKVYQPATIR
jgi:hypothetical protein